MSICEHLIDPGDSDESLNKKTPEEKLNLQNELVWGLSYRNYKEKEKNQPIMPMRSPIDIPFEICRAEMMMNRKNRKAFFDEAELKNEEYEKRGEKKDDKTNLTRKKRKKRPRETSKPSLLDRSVWSQDKYMNYLAIPSPKIEPPKQKKYKKRCELEPCPPRFVQLAVPNKRRVFANWKDFAHFLPAEILMRYEEILHTDQSLEPREARYYYKKLDRKKREEQRKKRRQENLKKKAEHKDSDWQKAQIDMLAADIVNYIKDEPLFTLNYKQMMLSDGILERLEKTKMLKKPSRRTKKCYKKTVIEVADKFAVWIDTLTRFVDVQAIESDEDIPPLSIGSLMGEGEDDEGEDGSSDFDSSSEDELRDDQLFGHEDAIFGEEGDVEFDQDEAAEAAKNVMHDLFNIEEGEDGMELHDMFDDLDGDTLGKLITILSNCSEDFLNNIIDDESMPGVRYIDVLNKLKEVKECLTQATQKPRLEQVMIDWALKNDPDNVNDAVLKKIHEVSCLMSDWFASTKPDFAAEHKADAHTGDDAGENFVFGQEEYDGQETTEGDGGASGVEPTAEGEAPSGDEGASAGEGTSGAELASGAEGAGGAEGTSGAEGPSGTDLPGATEGLDDAGAVSGADIAEGGASGADIAEGGTSGADIGGGTSGANIGGTSGADIGGGGVSEEGEGHSHGGAGEGEGGLSATESGFTETGEGGGTGPDSETRQKTSEGTLLTGDYPSEMEGGDVSGMISEFEGEEGMGMPHEYAPGTGIEAPGGEEVPREKGEEGMEVAVLYGEGAAGVGEEIGLDGRVIKGHKPSKVFEHSPDTVCCLSLKTWAVWLLEITHNAHRWTQWMHCLIQKIREYCLTVRGEVKLPNGEPKVLHKSEWRKFIKETDENIVAWRQYSAHVKDLSQSIIDNFHDKPVNCCPKCLNDFMIKNVVVAHDTLQALTEAISCAAYWQRCLDILVEKTCGLTQNDKVVEEDLEVSSDESCGDVDLEEIEDSKEDTGESVYEIEGMESNENNASPVS